MSADVPALRERLTGRTIALLESRRRGELATLVQKLGGIPYSAPALREVVSDDGTAISAFLDALSRRAPAVVIFQTGVGAERLFAQIGRLGRSGEWRDYLRGAMVVVRGPKPAGVLRTEGVRIDGHASAPYTTAELLACLDKQDLANRVVAVQHYGDRNAELVEWLESKGASVEEAHLYAWALPEDTGPLRRLLVDLAAQRIDAVAFTSQSQVTNLVTISEEEGTSQFLPDVLGRTIVAAVGPVTAAALVRNGIRVDITADPPKSGALMAALVTYFAERASDTPRWQRTLA